MFEEGDEKSKFREKIKSYLEHAENLKERLRPVVEEPSSRSFDGKAEWNDRPQVDFPLNLERNYIFFEMIRKVF